MFDFVTSWLLNLNLRFPDNYQQSFLLFFLVWGGGGVGIHHCGLRFVIFFLDYLVNSTQPSMIFCDYCSLVYQLIFCNLEFLINAIVCLWFSFSPLHMHSYVNTCPCAHTYTLWLVSFVCLLEHCINLYLDVGEMHLILFYLVFVYFLTFPMCL